MYMVAPVRGIPALTMGDDVCAVVSSSLNTLVWPDGGVSIWGDDVIVIAGKIIAKAQGRFTRRDELMAERFEEFDSRNLLMFRNVPRRMALYRPEHPDEEAARIRRGLAARFGGRPGVIISGSERERSRGRGRRDVALGSAGIDLTTESGESIVDSLAAMGGLAMNQYPDCPVAVIRGAKGVLTYED